MDFYKISESIIPALEYCSMNIEFTDKVEISFFNSKGKYYLFDVCLDKELCFETKEELLENIKSYLDTKEVSKFYMTTANYIYKK
jgi:hypothetical protein